MHACVTCSRVVLKRHRRVAPSDAGDDAAEATGEPTASRRQRQQQRRAAEESSLAQGDDARGDGAGGVGGEASAPAQAPADFGAQEFWDLCLVVDPVTEDQAAARKEVDELVKLLRKEGLTITDPEPLDPEEGFVGKVFALCTASQGELEQEAELMGINKPLKLSLQAQRKYRKSAQYGRVTAIFTAARREAFHKVPYFCPHPFQDDVLKPEHDHSGFEYFSACERQYLLEHMIESKVREAVRNHKMQPKTDIHFFPLHDKDGEGARDLVWLQEHWAQFFRPQRLWALLSFWKNPHNGMDEPIAEIRDYFGDQIAIYFAFLSFYTRWLLYPAVVGFGFWIWQLVEGTDNLGLVAYCVFICVWALLMIKFWERKQNAYAYYWFTSDLSSEEKVRREFYLAIDNLDNNRIDNMDEYDPSADGGGGFASGGKSGEESMFTGVQDMVEDISHLLSNVRTQNRKTGQIEEKYPKSLRVAKYLVMLLTVSMLLGIVVLSFIYFYLINIISEWWGDCSYGDTACSMMHALLIVVIGNVYGSLAEIFNDWETHRTDIKYENNLILKKFLFEFVNNFLSMFWIAFLATYYCSDLQQWSEVMGAPKPAEGSQSCLQLKTYNNTAPHLCQAAARKRVMGELSNKLMSIFLMRMFVGNATEVVIPMIKTWMSQRKMKAQKARVGKMEETTKSKSSANKNVDGSIADGATDAADELEGKRTNEGGEVVETSKAKTEEEEDTGKKKRRGRKKKGEGDPAEKDEGVDKPESETVTAQDFGHYLVALESETDSETETEELDELGEQTLMICGAAMGSQADDAPEAPTEAGAVKEGGRKKRERRSKKPGQDAEPAAASAAGPVGNVEGTSENGQTDAAGSHFVSALLASAEDEPQYPYKSRAWWQHTGRMEESMEVYGGGGDACTVDDYQELVIQFCFVTLFGAAFPLTGALALASNILELYVDSYKLCHTMQRPLAQRAAAIPDTWIKILKVFYRKRVFFVCCVCYFWKLVIKFFCEACKPMCLHTKGCELTHWVIPACGHPFNIHQHHHRLRAIREPL